MRFPIKLSKGILPSWCDRILRTKNNPRSFVDQAEAISKASLVCDRGRFSELVATITSGSTTKSTRPQRHKLTNQIISELCSSSDCTILDIGVSDGITTLELIELLDTRFKHFFVTDLSFSVSYIETDRHTYFYDNAGRCFLMATNTWIIFSWLKGAWFPIGSVAKRLLSRAPKYADDLAKKASQLQPDLLGLAAQDERITFQEYDVFTPWTGPQVDIVKVGNVLNRIYFSDETLLAAVENIKGALRNTATLLVTDNREIDAEHREVERVSVFTKNEQGYTLAKNMNGGVDIEDLIVNA